MLNNLKKLRTLIHGRVSSFKEMIKTSRGYGNFEFIQKSYLKCLKLHKKILSRYVES